MKKSVVALVLCLAAVIVFYVSFFASGSPLEAAPAVSFIDNFSSGNSVADVELMLRNKGIAFEKATTDLSRGRSKGEFNLDRIQINDYQHLGERGKLVLIFFSERLMLVSFYPKNVEAFSAKLLSNTKWNSSELPKYDLSDNLEVSRKKATDDRPEEYFSWKDKTLFGNYMDYTTKIEF